MKGLSTSPRRLLVVGAAAAAAAALALGAVVASGAGAGAGGGGPAGTAPAPVPLHTRAPGALPTPAPTSAPVIVPVVVAPPVVTPPLEAPPADKTVAEEDPGQYDQEEDPSQYEQEESTPVYQPRVTGMDWPDGDSVWCGDYVSNETVTARFSWVTGDADYVDLYTASSATSDLPTDGWVLAASGQSPAGAAALPFNCGSSGAPPYVPVRVVALSPAGSWTAHWWGVGASLRG